MNEQLNQAVGNLQEQLRGSGPSPNASTGAAQGQMQGATAASGQRVGMNTATPT